MSITSIIQAQPKIAIIVLSLLVSLFTTLVNYFLTDQNRLREIKKRQKDLQGEIKAHQKAGNHEKVLALNKEMMSYVGETFKHSMIPMLVTIVPILIFFSYLRTTFAATSIASSWIWYYLIAAIFSSMIFRKLFKMP